MSGEYKKTNLFGDIPQFNKFDEKYASILVEAMKKARKTSRNTKISKWIRQFAKLRTLDGLEKERIKKVLLWYIDHFQDRYVPQVFSPRSFRSKFFQIEAAMERITEDKEDDFKVRSYKKGDIIIDIIEYDS